MQPAAAKAPESALQPRGTASSPGQTPAARSGNTLIHAAAYSAPPRSVRRNCAARHKAGQETAEPDCEPPKPRRNRPPRHSPLFLCRNKSPESKRNRFEY